jgi:putative DNA methylase
LNDKYPKRLIEVDLPIKRISAHSRREKSIRHGHISTLHVWWARRPLAACRAVICAALWPDPADHLCPEGFRQTAREEMAEWANNNLKLLGAESYQRFIGIRSEPTKLDDNEELRSALLDFIADFSNWDNSTVVEYLQTSRNLTRAAHEGLGGAPETKPLIIDPFAGGGAIPLEALRVGADAFASDLNPIAVLLEKVTLEFIPRYGRQLAEWVSTWGDWIERKAKEELGELYPRDDDGAIPVGFLWARTVRCEGPGCGAELPLIGQTWLTTKDDRRRGLEVHIDKKNRLVSVAVMDGHKKTDCMAPIASRSSATCPICNYTTPAKNVREQLARKNGGSDTARLIAVVTTHEGGNGKSYRNPTQQDLRALKKVRAKLEQLENEHVNGTPLLPNEDAPPEGALGFRFQKYGIRKWRDLYTHRQLVALATLVKLVTGKTLREELRKNGLTDEKADAVQTCLALGIGRVNDLSSTLCRWLPSLEAVAASNGGQNKMPMILDFVEANPIGGAGGDWGGQIDWITRVIRNVAESNLHSGVATRAAAQQSQLPDDSAAALVTDPPYYDAFGYSDLSEFFFPWIRRAVPKAVLDYRDSRVPKVEEAVSIGKTLSDSRGLKDDQTYLLDMRASFAASHRVVRTDGIGVVVFANKTTAGWEAILDGLIQAEWQVTASWPIDTERPNRQRAIGSAALQSSVHLVCRPRKGAGRTTGNSDTGDWRDVQQELPSRIHDWMPRLAQEGVVGADAIFACLGPALEIFSRYARVEKASGDAVTLREYLEYVWAAVAKEALAMVFRGADASGFEEDARLTAMWLWTLSASQNGKSESGKEDFDEEESADDASGSAPKGYLLEYDAARKIAQGLGARLDSLNSVVEVKGESARLLPVAERTRKLFGKDDSEAPAATRKKKAVQMQLGFVAELEQAEEAGQWGSKGVPALGATALDRVHQSMILFAAGRGDALRRFLVDEGVGRDQRFWRLAQVLSYLYPSSSEEKRWIDGVLARKKGLGF